MSATLPDLTGMETFYGIKVSAVGEDGDLLALGHHEPRRVVAAFNAYSRKVIGLTNMLDDRDANYDDALAYVRDPGYAVLITECPQEDRVDEHDPETCGHCREIRGADWYLRWGSGADEPGAFPVTMAVF